MPINLHGLAIRFNNTLSLPHDYVPHRFFVQSSVEVGSQTIVTCLKVLLTCLTYLSYLCALVMHNGSGRHFGLLGSSAQLILRTIYIHL